MCSGSMGTASRWTGIMLDYPKNEKARCVRLKKGSIRIEMEQNTVCMWFLVSNLILS